MQHRELFSTHGSSGKAPITARAKFDPECRIGARSPMSAPADALGLAEYLHEDLGQTLVAIKLDLERLAQSELHGAKLASSISALQAAIRTVSSLAEEIRPAPAHRSRLRASAR